MPSEVHVQASSSYRYRPLNADAKEIRLLKVLPADTDEPLRCTLFHTRLADAEQKYETISYTWNDASVRSDCELDGQAIDIPASAGAALRRMRLNVHERVLWIDSLCIDQVNVEERSQQVMLMKDVYSNSAGNLIWLGEADESTEDALKSIRELVNEAEDRTAGLRNLHRTLHPSSELNDEFKLLMSRRLSSANIFPKALAAFWIRPWFRYEGEPSLSH